MSVRIVKSIHLYFYVYWISEFSAHCLAMKNSNMIKNCLLDLQMIELLRLRKSLVKVSAESEIFNNRSSLLSTFTTHDINHPIAMALIANKRGYSKSSPTYLSWQPEEKPSKLQTLFQISITALAFLSFGGYLLCLIVQAIKSKGTTYFHPVATATTTTLNGGIKRIKIYRRSRRDANITRLYEQILYDSYTHISANE